MSVYWSCAQTHPHEEALAIRNLRRQRFNAWYPFFLQKNRFRRTIVKPVFLNYVFIELDDEVPNWTPINSTLGIRRLLTHWISADEYRRPTKIHFVEDMRRLRIRHGDGGSEREVLPPGTVVRIRRGPFAERVALVEMATEDRVRLLLEAFNREVVIEFGVDDVVLIRRPTVALREVRV